MNKSIELLMALLAIPSPTYKEKQKTDYLETWVNQNIHQAHIERIGNNLLITIGHKTKKAMAFVGHTDTVPDFFEPHIKDGRVYGSGASDMQAGLASMLVFIQQNQHVLTQSKTIKIIIYDKEEGTPLHENGLNECLKNAPDFFKGIDFAIVAEPTNNALQLGCVGSIHCKVSIPGKAAHSARPWHGENALYNALPLIKKMADLTPIKQSVFDVDFYDVMSITESESTRGRTTIPDSWVANINYRFSPVHTLDDAILYMMQWIKAACPTAKCEIVNAVDAGGVIEHPCLVKAKTFLKIEAKQAWTDVAQLTKVGISAVNFGPGRQDQAHQNNEFVCIDDIIEYESLLKQLILEA